MWLSSFFHLRILAKNSYKTKKLMIKKSKGNGQNEIKSELQEAEKKIEDINFTKEVNFNIFLN